MKNVYAPILIPTLCRHEHFIRCIESLKKNTWAGYTDVYIGLDFPPSEEYVDGYKKICMYLHEGDFNQFASFNIIKREINYGSAKNMRLLREDIEKYYPYFIRSDDDAEFSVNFLEYMNKSLWYYMDDKDVIGITGYSYPIQWKVKAGANVFKMNYLCPMWGTAFYSDKFMRVRERLLDNYYENNITEIIKKKKYKSLSIARYIDFGFSVFNKSKSLLKVTSDVAISTFMSIDGDWCIISPTVTKVRNHGFDGSGEYCQNVQCDVKKRVTARNYDYSHQPLDCNDSFNIIPDESVEYKINRELLNKFDCRDMQTIMKANIRIWLFKIVGDRGFQWIRKLKRRNNYE